ncbi:MAG: hypothetical protein HQ505_05470 [Nitrosopumilus sp.]|nr:hypothetical protein [Nitrosopumilus sp.]
MNIEQELIQAVIAVLLLVGVGRILGMLCSRFCFPEIIGYVVTGIILGPYAISAKLGMINMNKIDSFNLIPRKQNLILKRFYWFS